MLHDAMRAIGAETPEPRFLLGVILPVLSRHSASQDCSARTIARPEQPAARIGVRQRGSVREDGRPKPVLLIVTGQALVQNAVTRRKAGRRPQQGLADRIILLHLICRVGIPLVGFTRRVHDPPLGNAERMHREDAVLIHGLRAPPAQSERNSRVRLAERDFIRVGVARINPIRIAIRRAPLVSADRRISCNGHTHIGRPGPRHERCASIAHDIILLEPHLSRIVAVTAVRTEGLVSADRHHRVRHPFKADDRTVPCHRRMRPRQVRSVALRQRQGFESVFVIIMVAPVRAIAPGHPHASVTAAMRRSIPVVRSPPPKVVSGVLLPVRLAQHRVLSVADPSGLHRRPVQLDSLRIVFRAGFPKASDIGVVESVGAFQALHQPRDVVDDQPDAIRTDERLVIHDVVLTADAPHADAIGRTVLVGDFPDVLKPSVGMCVDGQPGTIRNRLEDDIASARVGAGICPDRPIRRHGDIRILADLEGEILHADLHRTFRREREVAGDLARPRIAKRGPELDRVQRRPVAFVALPVRTRPRTHAARVESAQDGAPRRSGPPQYRGIPQVSGRSAPHLGPEDLHDTCRNVVRN